MVATYRRLWRGEGTMTKAVRQVLAFFWGSLGHCSVCIRKAFLTAAAAWSLTGLIAGSELSPVFLPAVVGAVGLTALWVAHLLVFAGRFSQRERKPDRAIQSANAAVEARSRRVVLSLFSRALIFGALVSAAPRQANARYARSGGCGREDCLPCWRPFYKRQGGYDCVKCRSCAVDCGGQTC
jgi:hypothetical protein